MHEPGTGIDLDAAEQAAGRFLRALGIRTDSESMRSTPERMARAYAELLRPRPFDLTTFPGNEGYDELVLARAIPVRSVRERHPLPFVGVAHVATCPENGSWDCPNRPRSSSTSPAAHRRRNA
nr:GTP cyclohydrolase I [Allosalinactinospora lopnorensis]